MSKASGNQRVIGRRLLLQEIRRCAPVPRIDLAESTGISRATVTTITADLLREGLIEEVGDDAEATAQAPGKGAAGDDSSAPPHLRERTRAGRGRPRVNLKIRGAARIVAGVKISHQIISMVLLDFEGRELASLEERLDRSVFSPEELAAVLAGIAQRLSCRIGKDLQDISGIGVGIAGIVDAPNGFVHWSPSLDRRNLHFGPLLASALGIPVHLDNDANLVAMAEKSFGLGKDHSDFIVVTIESGVGMGVVIGNEIYRGTRGCGAEFGHTKVHLDGALCRCGQRGCLEAYVADYALLREAGIAGGAMAQDVETLLAAARTGDPLARSIVRRAGRMFAMGLANLVNIFDPELIILAGEQMRSDHLHAEEVISAMRSSIVQVDKAPPEVVVHEWGDLMWARGAAAYALEQVSEAAVTGAGRGCVPAPRVPDGRRETGSDAE